MCGHKVMKILSDFMWACEFASPRLVGNFMQHPFLYLPLFLSLSILFDLISDTDTPTDSGWRRESGEWYNTLWSPYVPKRYWHCIVAFDWNLNCTPSERELEKKGFSHLSTAPSSFCSHILPRSCVCVYVMWAVLSPRLGYYFILDFNQCCLMWHVYVIPASSAPLSNPIEKYVQHMHRMRHLPHNEGTTQEALNLYNNNNNNWK